MRGRAYIGTQVVPLAIQTRLQVLAFVLVATFGCGPAPDPLGPTPGRSNRPRGGPPVPAARADTGPKMWERWSEVPAYRLAVARTASQHLAAGLEAETLANEVAAAYPDLGPQRTLPPGSVVLQRLFEPGAPGPVAVFAMVKRAPAAPGAAVDSAWEFLVLETSGLVQERGALGTCVRCHAEAPHDMLFGRAR